MVFRRNLHPVIATKNVVEASGVIAATTNTVLDNLSVSVDSATLAAQDSVERGATINGMFISIFFISEGGEIANEVPLVDWYIIKDQGGNFGTAFGGSDMPIPGSQGDSDNKRFVFHTEKGLAGGGDVSLSGVPMVFKGVIAIPRGFRKQNSGDIIKICARTNFATKFCVQAIYKWYH